VTGFRVKSNIEEGKKSLLTRLGVFNGENGGAYDFLFWVLKALDHLAKC
jgi:hypothetical protein